MIKRLGGKNWAESTQITYLIAILAWFILDDCKIDLLIRFVRMILAALLSYRIFVNKPKAVNTKLAVNNPTNPN